MIKQKLLTYRQNVTVGTPDKGLPECVGSYGMSEGEPSAGLAVGVAADRVRDVVSLQPPDWPDKCLIPSRLSDSSRDKPPHRKYVITMLNSPEIDKGAIYYCHTVTAKTHELRASFLTVITCLSILSLLSS